MKPATILLACALLASHASAVVYWWEYRNEDCENVDASNCMGSPQPCKDKSLAGLESACLQTSGCVAFNSDGYLKVAPCSPSTMKSDKCNLYFKKDTPQPSPTPPPPALVPAPQSSKSGSTVASINAGSFAISASPSFTDMTNAVIRYQALMFDHASSPTTAGDLTGLNIFVKDPTAKLDLNVDESYTMYVPSTGTANITAATYYGALRGLETFSQLVQFNFDTGMYFIPATPWQVMDAPRFAHRGILLDTARHFEPLRSIRHFLDSMSYAKFNVLHWHIVDEQSVPYVSTTRPKFSEGAYSNFEKYYPADMAAIVEYARERGIRVIPEFDTPGHAAAWCVGEPSICPSPSCTMPLNPATNATFDFISDLFKDVTQIFTDDYLHLGGDEVDTSCWTSTQSVNAWLTAKNFTADNAYEYFVERVQVIARGYGRTTVNWEEVWNHFTTTLPPSSVIQIWKSKAVLAEVVNAGYRGILSNSDVWYLDHLSTTWEEFYLNEPFDGISNTTAHQFIMGGEVCQWGETVDESDLESTVWPRAAAAAERLWSPQAMNNTAEFQPRLQSFRCLLNRRGVGAAPVDNPTARTAPPRPGGCFGQ